MIATPHDPAARASHLHPVQACDTSGALLPSAAEFLGTFLREGAGAVVVATPGHRERIAAHLDACRVDVERAARQGRYLSADASELLDRVTVRGRLDRARFAAVVGGLLQRTALVLPPDRRRGGAYSEMAALLDDTGAAPLAAEIAHAWDSLAQEHAFTVMCGAANAQPVGRGTPARPPVLRVLHEETSPAPRPATLDTLARQILSLVAAHALPLDLHVDGEWLIATTRTRPGFALHVQGGGGMPRIHIFGEVQAQEPLDEDVWEPLWRLLEGWGARRHEARSDTGRHYPDLMDRML